MLLDRSTRVIGAVAGLITISGIIVSVSLWAGGRAGAAEVVELKGRVIILETHGTDMDKRIDWLCEGFGQLAIRNGVSLAPIPERAKREQR